GTFAIQNGVDADLFITNVTNTGDFTLGSLAQLQTNTFNQDDGSLNVAGILDTNSFVTSGASEIVLQDGEIVVDNGNGIFELGASATLSGNGTINGNVVVEGVITPGFSFGNLTITGDLSFENGGTLLLETDGSGGDILTVEGVVDLTNLILEIQVADGEIIEAGENLISIDAEGITGEIESVVFADSNGIAIDTQVEFDPDTGTIEVITNETVPEPLTAVSLISLIVLAHRRRKYDHRLLA
ncbi:MAG: hypothetical protein AAGH99_06185, partial [Planctomycetota bacterium]